ncbi:acyl-CoA N-acyltransferase [Suillus americanus]|nr:acyl-CoA N-acyltransferase [Suillus americanus]
MTYQLHPLEINPKTGEPFLRLAAPYQNIIITPPRQGDQSVLIQHLNDPAIYGWIERPPIPYLPEHADFWIQLVKGESDDTLEYLRKGAEDFPNGPLQFVGASPVRYLREVKEDGTDVLIGDVNFKRSPFEEVLDEVERKRLQEDNAKKQAGDPTIQYAIGDWLAASHHGRGIMTAAIGLLMTAWGIPRMGVRHVVAHTFAGNIGSNRVFEKNGFVNRGLFDNGKIVRGEKKVMTLLEWKLDENKI